MDSKQLEHILSISTQILNGKNLSTVLDLIVLKYLNDLFEEERQEIRQDFLLRGICSREVDGLIEEPAYYKSYFIPKVARWSDLNLDRLQFAYLELVNINHLNIAAACEKLQDAFTVKQIYALIDMCDFGVGTIKEKEENIQFIRQWTANNNLNQGLLILLNS